VPRGSQPVRKEDTMIVLVIGITTTLGLIALGIGGGVLGKPPPLWRGGHPSPRPPQGNAQETMHRFS
jgi:hypothetical protein